MVRLAAFLFGAVLGWTVAVLGTRETDADWRNGRRTGYPAGGGKSARETTHSLVRLQGSATNGYGSSRTGRPWLVPLEMTTDPSRIAE